MDVKFEQRKSFQLFYCEFFFFSLVIIGGFWYTEKLGRCLNLFITFLLFFALTIFLFLTLGLILAFYQVLFFLSILFLLLGAVLYLDGLAVGAAVLLRLLLLGFLNLILGCPFGSLDLLSSGSVCLSIYFRHFA